MKQLLYSSRVVTEPELDDLQSLLAGARARNARLGITGLLIYGSQRFVQILEGPIDAIDEVFADIREDRRHTSVVTMHETFIDFRSYPKWAMAFQCSDRTGNSTFHELDELELRDAPPPLLIEPIVRNLAVDAMMSTPTKNSRLH